VCARLIKGDRDSTSVSLPSACVAGYADHKFIVFPSCWRSNKGSGLCCPRKDGDLFEFLSGIHDSV